VVISRLFLDDLGHSLVCENRLNVTHFLPLVGPNEQIIVVFGNAAKKDSPAFTGNVPM
jgi:hypothetical protein